MTSPALPPLPESIGHLHSNGDYCTDSTVLGIVRWPAGMFTEEQMHAYATLHGQQCRDEALEAAARQCDDMVKAAHAVNHPVYADIPLALALAIRALKTTPPQGEPR